MRGRRAGNPARCRLIGASLGLLTLLPDPSAAQSCSVSPANGSYGAVDILSGSAVDTSTTFTLSCTGTANQIVRLCVEFSPGQTNSSGQRRLASGSDRLVHELYADAARTTVWGSWGLSTTAYGTAGQTYDLTLQSNGTGNATLTVYGRVAANQQTAGPGSNYIWTMSTAPAAEYDYKTSTACPTGTKQATSGGSSWTASIAANCLISGGTLNFGSNPSFISSNVDATATVSVQCTNSTPYSIGMSSGANASGSQNRMRLGATSNYVTYSLYTDPARTTLWTTTASASSCTSGAGTCVLGTGSGSSQSISVYGRVPPQSVPTIGSFTDTVVVTVTF